MKYELKECGVEEGKALQVMKLFAELGKMYSKVHWEQRKKLKPLAKWPSPRRVSPWQ